MVMHARKQPKLNDGYADRKDTHLHQDMQYHSSLFADDSDDDGPLGSRIGSRYPNKSSYIERNKEKRGSLSLAEKKVSHYLATGSLGRPIPMETSFTFTGEHSSSGVIPDTSRPTPSSSTSQRKERTVGGQAANNGKQTATSGKEKEVQKSAIRVFGDWSEHISSSGKRYYYNCKTEVSQWEKPKEWNSEMCKTPEHRPKDVRSRTLLQTHPNQISADSRASRHSSSSELSHEHTRSHTINTGDSVSESHPGRDPSLSNTLQYYRDSRESRDSQQLSRENSRELQKPGDRTRPLDSVSSNSHYHPHHQVAAQRSGNTPGGNNGLSDSQHIDYKRLQHEGQYSSHVDYKRSSSELSQRRRDSLGSQRYHDTGQGPVDDMDISPSPSPSPSSSRPSSSTGTPQLPPTSTPIANTSTPAYITTTPGSHRSSPPLGNPIPTLVNRQTVNEGGGSYDKTIQTLQELQKVLSMHIRAQQNTTNIRVPVAAPQGRHPSVAMSSHQGTSPQHLMCSAGQGGPMVSSTSAGLMPHSHPYNQTQLPATAGMVPGAQGDDGLGGRTSPVSATSSRSSCGSPTPSDSSSQNATITSQALTAAAIKREETAKLTASLSNYYNEKLIGHVLGWQADLVEKQAARLWEESMVSGSEQCSRISVQLKRARSQVRIAEIQSTLHEQRIMSSEQQRQEIDNLKTPSNFLPS
ncbi:hypothetical protein BsWGS_24707 [Bradybaena similaris]